MNDTFSFCTLTSSNSVPPMTPDYGNQTYDCATSSKVSATFLLFFILMGLPWNILILYAILKEKLYQQPAIVLLLNLIISDILIQISTLSVVTTGFAGKYLLGSTDNMRCVTYRLFIANYNALLDCSLLTIALMSLDRFLYVYKPFQYERLATPRKMLVVVINMIAVYIFIALILYFSPKEVSFEPSLQICNLNYPEYISGSFLIFDIVIVVFIAVCNIIFSCIALKKIRKVYNVNTSTSATTKSQLCSFTYCMRATFNQKQNRINRVFCGLILPSLALWPLYIITTWLLYCVEFDKNSLCVNISVAYVIVSCRSVIHPIIQTWFIPDVRNTLKKIVIGRLKLSIASAVDAMQSVFRKRIKHLSTGEVQQ